MTDYLIKKSTIDAMPGLDKTHYLNSKAIRNNKSLGDLTGLTGLGFHIIDVPPGAWSTEYHAHHFEDECTYVLSGVGEVRIGESTHDIGPGDFIGYPKGGDAHTMKNTGTEHLVCIVVGERLNHDVADYPDLGKRLFRNGDLPWSLSDADQLEHPTGGAK